ncbi:MAG: glucose-6-phosphate isomerase [Sphaerochaetaceae bacterium]
MQFKNLNELNSFTKLKNLKPTNLHTRLTKNRIENSLTPCGGDLTFNWAATPIEETHLKVLQELADEQQVIEKYQALLAGEVMNTGEKRLVLHHLTRGRVLGEDTSVFADGEEKGAFYQEQLKAIQDFSEAVRSGQILSSAGQRFSTVVQIGIGGSDLGPRALYHALKGSVAAEHRLKAYFISNVDPDDAYEVFEELDFASTLFILVTKSGTTQETLTNLEMVKQTMLSLENAQLDPSKHIVAVTSKSSPLATSTQFLKAFFIDDYVGGRYSSTSAVGGVILALIFGFDTFRQLLNGAHSGDANALELDIRKNGALLDALIGIYYRNVLHYPYTAILPYSQALLRFPAHLQQLDMESNGKQVNRWGEKIGYESGPVIFGEPGTNGQHSFYQLLHQGTNPVPLQFIAFKNSQRKKDIVVDGSTSQTKLIANLIAQIVAFAQGKEDENSNKNFPGNRYSSVLVADQLSPYTLGALLAHYENKVMFQGFLWNINSFDQEGVQLGKVLANHVLTGNVEESALQGYMDLLL